MKFNYAIILSTISFTVSAMEQDMNAPGNLSPENTAGVGQIAGWPNRGLPSMWQYQRDDVGLVQFHDDLDVRMEPANIETVIERYKKHLITQKAYEAAQGYLFASPGKIADWDKAATIMYNAGYQLPVNSSKLGITITNLLIIQSLEIDKLKRSLTRAQIADIQAEAEKEWKVKKSEYEKPV